MQHRQNPQRWLIAGVVLVVIAAIGVAGFVWYQQQTAKRQLKTAIDNTIQLVQSPGGYAVEVVASTSNSDEKATEIQLSGDVKGSLFSGLGVLNSYVGKVPVSVSGDVRAVNDEVFVKPESIGNALDAAIKADSSLKDYKNYAEAIAEPYDGKWIALDGKDDTLKSCTNVKVGYSTRLRDAIVAVANEVGVRNDNELQYEIPATAETLNTFFNQASSGDPSNDSIARCLASLGDTKTDSLQVTLTVSTAQQRITKIVFSNESIHLTVVITPSTRRVDWSKVAKPDAAIPLTEVQESLENIIGSPLKL